MKKIVFLTQNLKCGGVQKSVTTLANFLKNKYEIIIVLLESNKEYFYETRDIKIIEVETKIIDINKENIGIELYSYRINELNKILKKVSPNVVISYEDYHNLILLNSEYKCKKIVSVRNSIFNLYNGDEKIHLLDSDFYFNNIKSKYSKADKVITVSKYIENELKQLASLDNITTIYNGITNESFVNKKTIFEKPYILNVARINKRKGHLDLIKAFDLIKDYIPHDLIIIGDGIERKKVEVLISELKLTSRIKLLGTKNPKKYIDGCDLFVFPSKSEGFSNSILEVMSAKKNIVAYEYNGAKEILPKENLIDINDINALANKIIYFLKNKTVNEQFAQKLYNISKNFSLYDTLVNYKKEIDKLCVE